MFLEHLFLFLIGPSCNDDTDDIMNTTTDSDADNNNNNTKTQRRRSILEPMDLPNLDDNNNTNNNNDNNNNDNNDDNTRQSSSQQPKQKKVSPLNSHLRTRTRLKNKNKKNVSETSSPNLIKSVFYGCLNANHDVVKNIMERHQSNHVDELTFKLYEANPAYAKKYGMPMIRDMESNLEAHAPILTPEYTEQNILDAIKKNDSSLPIFGDEYDFGGIPRYGDLKKYDDIARRNKFSPTKIKVGYDNGIPLYGTPPSEVFHLMLNERNCDGLQELQNIPLHQWDKPKLERLRIINENIYIHQLNALWYNLINEYANFFNLPKYHTSQRSDYVCNMFLKHFPIFILFLYCFYKHRKNIGNGLGLKMVIYQRKNLPDYIHHSINIIQHGFVLHGQIKHKRALICIFTLLLLVFSFANVVTNWLILIHGVIMNCIYPEILIHANHFTVSFANNVFVKAMLLFGLKHHILILVVPKSMCV